MADIALTLAAAFVGICVALLILRGIELCVDHEMRMLQQRASELQSDRLRGGEQGLGVHTDTYVSKDAATS